MIQLTDLRISRPGGQNGSCTIAEANYRGFVVRGVVEDDGEQFWVVRHLNGWERVDGCEGTHPNCGGAQWAIDCWIERRELQEASQ